MTGDDRSVNTMRLRRRVAAVLRAVVALSLGTVQLRADQVEMQNGDRYVGTVLSLGTNTLVLHSEVLGDLTLPRGKVALITLRPGPVTNSMSLLTSLPPR